jgi:SPP1 family predicted phage head-tail adaptor
VEAGKLRERLVIQSLTRVSDGGGGSTTSFSDVATVWGAVAPVSGTEGFEAGSVRSKQTHNVWIRYRTGLKPSEMRLKWGTRLLNITSVEDKTGRKATLVLGCEELLT